LQYAKTRQTIEGSEANGVDPFNAARDGNPNNDALVAEGITNPHIPLACGAGEALRD
jgi:hypothetical protein